MQLKFTVLIQFLGNIEARPMQREESCAGNLSQAFAERGRGISVLRKIFSGLFWCSIPVVCGRKRWSCCVAGSTNGTANSSNYSGSLCWMQKLELDAGMGSADPEAYLRMVSIDTDVRFLRWMRPSNFGRKRSLRALGAGRVRIEVAAADGTESLRDSRLGGWLHPANTMIY